MGKSEKITNKKVKITYNNLGDNTDIDLIFREMDKCFSKMESQFDNFDSFSKQIFDSNSNISIEIIDNNKKENKPPKKLSFKKWLKWNAKN